MKSSKYNSFTRRILRKRPRKAGVLIARNLIVRALRREGLSHVLQGSMAIIGFVYPPSFSTEWLKEASDSLLQEITPKQQACAMFTSRSSKDPKDLKETLADHLAQNHIFFGFAADLTHYPDTFRLVVDRLGSVDLRAIEVAFQAIMGIRPPSDVLESAKRLPGNLLNAALKPGRPSRDVTNILRRYCSSNTQTLTPPNSKPSRGLARQLTGERRWPRILRTMQRVRIKWSDVDRGALISGPSGTGKTLFVQALGATCGIPVHVHSLARWQAKGHLGDLLRAMRAAFDQAIDNAPCLLFLDEIDSFGSRDRFSGDSEQYCREVVNGLLECLDGVEKRAGVVVIGATNLADKIDAALLRPGRPDRHIRITLPDAEARSGILRHHLGSQLAGIDLSNVAVQLEETTGATIEQIVRDARRRARNARRDMTLADLTTSLPARVYLSKAAFTRVCVHEAGHALMGYLLRAEAGVMPVQVKVSRELRQTRAGGRTLFQRVPGFDRPVMAYATEITTLLAGLAAEVVILGEHADGGGGSADSDLHQATIVAASMIASLGLGGSLIYLTSDDADQLLERVGTDENLRRRVEALLGECFDQAQTILGDRRKPLEAMAQALTIRNEMNAREIAEIIESTMTVEP